MTRRFDFWALVSIATWAILFLLLIIPVGSVLLSSFIDRSGNTTLANYLAFISEPRYQRAFINTLIVGFGGLFGAMLLGSIMAFCISRFQIKGSRFVSLLAILALVSPPFIGAYSWIVLFGAGGVVRAWAREIGITMPPIYGVGGILIVFALKFYPFVYLMVSGALSNVNRSLEEAAEGLGLTPLQRTFQISFPLVLPALTAGGLLALIARPASLGPILAAMERRFAGAEIVPVHPDADKPAIRIVIRAHKGSRAGLGLLPPLILHTASGGVSERADALANGRASLFPG